MDKVSDWQWQSYGSRLRRKEEVDVKGETHIVFIRFGALREIILFSRIWPGFVKLVAGQRSRISPGRREKKKQHNIGTNNKLEINVSRITL